MPAFAGGAGAGSDVGQAGQRGGGGEAGAAVADLGEQPGGAHGARARQAGEQVAVGVGGELFADLLLEGGDLLAQRLEGREIGQRDLGSGQPVVAGQAAGRCQQPGVQLLGCGAAAVADGLQPVSEPLGAEPVGQALVGEAREERQADRCRGRRTARSRPETRCSGAPGAGWRSRPGCRRGPCGPGRSLAGSPSPGCPGPARAAAPGRSAACRSARRRRTGRPCCPAERDCCSLS